MKRSEPLRSDPEKTRAWQQRSRENGREGMRSAALRREQPLKRAQPKRKRRSPTRRVTVENGEIKRESVGAARRREREEAARWNRGVRGIDCVVCGKRPAVEGHHIIKVQILRREAQRRGFDFEDVRWDIRNRLAVCKNCHADHHSRRRPISRQTLERFARWVFDFAREVTLLHVLDREYPDCSPQIGETQAARNARRT